MSKTTMPVEEALGTLIVAANPYLKGPRAAVGAAMHLAAPKDIGTNNIDIADIHMEEDSKYPAEWMFKGQSQKIHTALRIQYRYPQEGPNGERYMVTDYLLVGFEGSGGGQ
jgi:hypothetical protein